MLLIMSKMWSKDFKRSRVPETEAREQRAAARLGFSQHNKQRQQPVPTMNVSCRPSSRYFAMDLYVISRSARRTVEAREPYLRTRVTTGYNTYHT